MHQNRILGGLYKNKVSGDYLRLLVLRDSDVNTYLQVDCLNVPIVKKRPWSTRPCQQNKIVTSFAILIKIL